MVQKGDEPRVSRESLYLKIGKYAAIGLEFPSTVVGGLFLGYAVDIYFASFPWLTAFCTIFALVGAFIRLFQLLKRFSDEHK